MSTKRNSQDDRNDLQIFRSERYLEELKTLSDRVNRLEEALKKVIDATGVKVIV